MFLSRSEYDINVVLFVLYILEINRNEHKSIKINGNIILKTNVISSIFNFLFGSIVHIFKLISVSELVVICNSIKLK